jgi:GNAT superfamily N-acetyltransferase
VATVYAATTAAWDVFATHHYLAATLNGAAQCHLATIGDAMFGFTAVLPFPNGNLRNAFREHRTVVLPDFQGMGLGVRLSDFIADHYVTTGRRYFSRTAHPRMGSYRDASPLWRATSSSQVQARKLTSYMSDDYLAKQQRTGWDAWDFDTDRVAWSHEYIGKHPITHSPIDRTPPLILGLAL